jgi:hypothetical protein
LGEDSIFNGNLPDFRDSYVQATLNDYHSSHGISTVQEVILEHANLTISKMTHLAGKDNKNGSKLFKKLIDKMLFNYKNIGMVSIILPQTIIFSLIFMITLICILRHFFN